MKSQHHAYASCSKKTELVRELVDLAAEISELIDRKHLADDLRYENTAAALNRCIAFLSGLHEQALAALQAHEKSHGC
jgi:hypothetical protein